MNNRLAVRRESVEERLDAIRDPITGKGLFTSGRISGLEVRDGGKVSFTIEAPAGVAEHYVALRDRAETEVRALDGVKAVTAVLTAHEPKSAHAGGVGAVKQIIAVASAKGGVGKSTVALNLACAFASLGLKTGLLDLDVYGPSAPTLLGVAGKKPRMLEGKILEPLEAFGLKTMSIGYLVDPASPMIWRGAMATSAVRQMIDEVAWGDLDVLLLDLPPGTGDVQLTLVQRVPLAGAVIVSTPQDIALLDARKGLNMFRKVDVPVFGIVENMSYFVCPHCGERSEIFSHGGARAEAEKLGTDFLGEIPLHIAIRETSDAGTPITVSAPDSEHAKIYKDIAARVWRKIEEGAGASAARAPRIVIQ